MQCENCDIEHDGSYGSGRFCSKRCAHSFAAKVNRTERNKKVSATLLGRTHPNPGNKGRKLSTAHIEILRLANVNKGVVNYIGYVEKWLRDEITGLQKCGSLRRFVKKYIHEKYNNKCARCGWNEINKVTNKVPVEIDHIDGDWRNCTEKNLILLCPNCHSLTPTYRALNKRKAKRNMSGQRKQFED